MRCDCTKLLLVTLCAGLEEQNQEDICWWSPDKYGERDSGRIFQAVWRGLCVSFLSPSLPPLPGQIVEVAIVTEKGQDRRRGFVFVTYTTEEAVDKITQIQFHTIQDTKVRSLQTLT